MEDLLEKYQGKNQKTRERVGGSKQVIVGSNQSGSEMFESRISGTEWVKRSNQLGIKFDQNRVGGSNQAIMEQVGQHNMRDRVSGSKQVIRERSIGRRDLSGSECLVASDWGSRDQGLGDQ